MEMDLKTLPGKVSPASVSLEEGYKDSETQITLSDTQSVPVQASCMTFVGWLECLTATGSQGALRFLYAQVFLTGSLATW